MIVLTNPRLGFQRRSSKRPPCHIVVPSFQHTDINKVVYLVALFEQVISHRRNNTEITMGSISDTSQSLTAAVEEAQERYTRANALSKEAYDEACHYLPGGNTRTVLHTTPFPLTFKSAHSCYLETTDGHQLVDFLGEYTAGIYGHNHPVIRSAIESSLARGWNYAGMSGLETKLAKHVQMRFPAIDLVRFVNSGTEANMMALATALAYTKKEKVLVFNKGYHGSTISGRAPSGKPSINLPHDFVLGTYNDVEGTEKLISSLPPDSLAAILLEPMLGSGGCYVASKEFLSTLRRLANEHRALLIFDEVMTSRLTYNGLGATFLPDIKPDLMTLGKWVGGGMSFGAFGGRKDIMELYDPRNGMLEHPGTFNNNVFSMGAGIAGCEYLTEERINALNSLGDKLRTEMEGVLVNAGIVTDKHVIPTRPVLDAEQDNPELLAEKRVPKMFIKGRGSLLVVHFTGPQRTMLQSLYFHHMMEQGLYLAQRGFVALNIELEDEHIDQFVDATKVFVETYGDFL
jgi:glutamate-1-semialdehyde 2,1-aminomutase